MNEYNTLLASLLSESVFKSIDSTFEEILDKHINITKSVRSEASTSQKFLRQFLNSETNKDDTFPRIMSINDNDFIGGSFARHTKIKPLDDIDIYFPIDGHNLVYWEIGIRSLYQPVNDDVITTNPILHSRWCENGYVSSTKLVSEFAKALNRLYPNATKVRPDNQAVNIQMSKCGTEHENGLGFDVVPCFLLRKQDAFVYLIPSGYGGWIKTNPRIDSAAADDLQRKTNKVYRKCVKLVKYWNTQKVRSLINSSYFIELSICLAFYRLLNQGGAITSISQGLAVAFSGLKEAVNNGSLQSLVDGAPRIYPGISVTDGNRIIEAAAGLAQSARQNEVEGKNSRARQLWNAIFKDDFPSG